MQKKFLFLSTIFLALTTMPVDVFAGMANNLLQPDSPEILEEAERIKKEANRFAYQYDAVKALNIKVRTSQIQKTSIHQAVEFWKQKCENANPLGLTNTKKFKAIESISGSDTVYTCLIDECSDSFKYKVSKDRTMCEMTKEYERQLDRAAKEQKKEEKQQQKQEDNLKETKAEIISSKDNISVGDSITYNDSDYNELKPLIEQWKNACASVVKKTFSNAVSDPEAVPAGKGKSKITCYIRSCGRDDLQVSRNRKSCEQTAEAKKLEKEYSKNDTRVDDLIAKINNTQVKIGASITIPSAMNVFEAVTAAKEAWADKCIAIKNDTVKEAFIDYSPDGNTLTCVIEECNQSGYDPDTKGLKCEETTAEKQRKKEQERENEKDRCGGRNGTWDEKKGCLCNGKKMPKGETECLSSDGKKYSVKDDGSKKIIDEINTSKKNMKIGASISIPENLLSVNDKINTAISEWEQKCDSIKTDNISSTTTDEKSINGKKKITCIIYNCLPKYTKSKDNKSCVINDNELNDDEKSLKEACEKKEKGKWVIRGETSTCICPKTVDGYFFDKELKKCIIDSDENCPANTKYNEETKTCDTVPGSECTPKDKRASKGKFNSETKQCESAECKNPDKYEVVEGKCLSKNKIEREQQKLQMAAEKDFIADVNKLISAFNTVAEKYKPECSTSDNEGQS